MIIVATILPILTFAATVDTVQAVPNPQQNNPSGLEVLLIISLAGAFGGFVDGLSTRKPYTFAYKDKTTDIGFLGDIFVGAAASIAIFTVAGAVFGIDNNWHEIETPAVFMRVVALGVLSGYVGIRLLNPLSAKLVKEIADDAAKKAVQESATVNWEVALNVQEGNQIISDYDRILLDFNNDHKKLLASAKINEANNMLKEAAARFDMALSVDPISRDANRGKARVLRREAEIAKAGGNDTDAANKWKSAIQLLTEIIQRDPNSAFALYNRSCYRLLSNAPKDSVLEDLEAAIKIHEQLKGRALRDPDFKVLRDNNDKEFNKLLS